MPGGTITGQLGAVQVTDLRGNLVSTWITTVTSTAFTTGGASAAETIPVSAVKYWSGPTTATTGTGVFTPGPANAAVAATLTSTAGPTAMTMTLGVGNNTATWNPTLVVAAPAAAVLLCLLWSGTAAAAPAPSGGVPPRAGSASGCWTRR